jgi:[acyl-carrier-protein] S-malonyltransferase
MQRPVMLFPGQGAQYVGMAASLLEQHESVRHLYAAAEERVGVDFAELSLKGPKELLTETRNTQPAIYLHSVALAALAAERNLRPHAVAGHSLGEYSALAAGGWIDPLDGLALVRRRGELMYQAGLDWPGTMAAVIGMKPDVIESACAQATEEAGVVQPANFNCPGQVAISGSVEGVDRALAILKERGGRLLKKLQVSGAFHSPLMEPARQDLLQALSELKITKGFAPVYCNVTGTSCDDPDTVRDLLGRQLSETVRWEDSMRALLADGFDTFIECGPGKVLSGLMKRIDKTATLHTVDTAEELNSLFSGGDTA